MIERDWLTLCFSPPDQLEKDATARATSESLFVPGSTRSRRPHCVPLELHKRPLRESQVSVECELTTAPIRSPVEGISPNMTGHNLDLSPKVFKALTSNNLKLGMTLAQWWLTDEKHRPHSSLSRPTATAGDWAGETENDMRVTIATVPNPTNAATANGNEPQAIAGGFQTADFRRRY